ncbi:hypothetical protein ACLMJK_001902 [Lecanora helva]
MPFQYKHVVMIGATSGIGGALSSRLIQEGSKVIAVGRRQDRLDDFVNSHGKDRASSIRFDISDRKSMDSFVDKLALQPPSRPGHWKLNVYTSVTQANPDLDCVFLNAGTQSRTDLTDTADFDLSAFHAEIATNFSSFVDLTMKFLPFLKAKNTETSLIYTTSNLAIVPAAALPAYSASKAALNAFILCLRDQLRNSQVKVIELSPPVVQTELHDYMGKDQGRQLGMPLSAFTDEAYKRLTSGDDQIVIGSIGPADAFNDLVNKRKAAFEDLAKMMRSHS